VLLAALHLLALGIGLGAVWGRAAALRRPLDTDGLRRVFAADTWWGVAGVVWIATGLARAFGGFEKGSAHYLGNPLFHLKMALLALLLALELVPIVTLIRWRIRFARGEPIDGTAARAMARISVAQAAIVAAMVALAVALARGVGG
jgi:putative membrane protein